MQLILDKLPADIDTELDFLIAESIIENGKIYEE